MLLITALHWIGSYNDYYSATSPFDIPMHFMGGAWVALFGLWASETTYGAFLKRFVSIRSLLIYVLVVGIAWEFLELALGFNSAAEAGYWSDTFTDLIMDMLGASVVACIYGKLISKKSN